MTSIEFWKYYTKKNILDIFDITYDFFADGLPEEFVEEYDVVEVILETLGHNETAKNYDKILKFTDLLKTQYPGLYQDNFQYIDVKLVRYYCFNQERDKAVAAFSNFIENPTQNFDYYCKAFDILMYYGNVDLIDKAVTTNYKTVRESDEIICGAEGDLALAKYMLILEDAYTNGTFDATKSAKALKAFGFNLPKDLFLLQGQTLLSPLPV